MKATTLKPLELDYLIGDLVQQSLGGSPGMATLRIGKVFLDSKPMLLKTLNKKLIEIELEARKKTREAIEQYINS